ncbi:MAG TPA: hypothetical protein VE981_17650 [Planctomycetota bacterium]|nr:hypothetical protein [Planctomycetota bacterium]
MNTLVMIGTVMGGIFGILLLVGYLLNSPRARRWDRRAEEAGSIHCGSCGGVGTLVARTTSSGYASSSNMVLACSKCGSHDWRVKA